MRSGQRIILKLGGILFSVDVSSSCFVVCLFASILILVLSGGSSTLKDNTEHRGRRTAWQLILLTSEDILKSIQSKAPRVLHSFYIVKLEKQCIE